MKKIRKGSRQEAMLKFFLSGRKLSVRNSHKELGISNPSREVIRVVEHPFNLQLNRKECKGKTRYGSHSTWYEYSATPSNKKKIAEVLKNQTANK